MTVTTSPSATTLSGAEALDRLLVDRWSCRAFEDTPLPRATIAEIIASAARTPSWCNTQPWQLHVLSGASTTSLRAALREAVTSGGAPEPDIDFPASYEGEFAERRRRAGWQLYEAVGVAKGDREASAREMLKNFNFFGAPHVAIVTTARDLGPYGAVDCGLFIQSFLLAAQARGVGCIPQAALATQSPTIREFLSLPDDRQVLVGISFGIPDLQHPVNGYRTERRPADDVATWLD